MSGRIVPLVRPPDPVPVASDVTAHATAMIATMPAITTHGDTRRRRCPVTVVTSPVWRIRWSLGRQGAEVGRLTLGIGADGVYPGAPECRFETG